MDELVSIIFDISTIISDSDYIQIMDLLKQIHDHGNNINYSMNRNGDDIYSHIVNGKLHGIGNPAKITIRNNKVICEEWYKEGQLHRDDCPAVTGWYKNGQIKYEMWYKRGQLHSNDCPAVIGWYKNGQIKYEMWYWEGGNYYRNSGPTWTTWYMNGQVKYEIWHKMDNRYIIFHELITN